MPLDNIKNLALKNLGVTMVKGGLGASAIRAYIQVVKMVVASAVNEEGEALLPPQVESRLSLICLCQGSEATHLRRGCSDASSAAPAKKYHRVLYTLCAASGIAIR